MGIDIYDQNLLYTHFLKAKHGHGYIVEKAKTPEFIPAGVVPGGPDKTKSHIQFILLEALGRFNHPGRRKQ
jgi:hypothetical protein